MDDESELQRLTKIAYLYLSDWRSIDEVRQILCDRGAAPDQIDAAISAAKRSLQEEGRYKNGALFRILIVATAIVGLGIVLMPSAQNAPGRFRGMPYTMIGLGALIAGYGLWSRAQRY